MNDMNKSTETFNRLIKPKNNIIANYLSRKATILASNCATLNQYTLATQFKDNQWYLDYLDKLNNYSTQY